MTDESRRFLDIKTKDELIDHLSSISNQLSKFVKISENVNWNTDLSPQFHGFIDLLNQLKDVPDKLEQTQVIIQKTFEFIDCIIGEVHDIRIQLEQNFSHESVLKSAVEALDKIPDSTMKATDQILNNLDGITARESEVTEVFNMIMENPAGISEQNLQGIKRIQELFVENQNDHFAIMDALQFQDITTQQIQHVNHLLETTELKLSELALKFSGLGETDIKKILESKEKKTRVFDPQAEYKIKIVEQSFANDLYEKKNDLTQNDIESVISDFEK